VRCEDERVTRAIAERYTFEVPGAKFDRRVRRGWWDGKVRLFEPASGLLYAGLWLDLARFCIDSGWRFEGDAPQHSVHEYYLDLANDGTGREARDYQREIFESCLSLGRRLVVSPTGSGKSLSIYHLIRHYAEPTLVVVPRVGLVKQLAADFVSYGMDPARIHGVKDWDERDSDDVVIVTYQSIYKRPAAWFDKFRLVIGDEAHHFKARTLVSIMTKLKRCPHRFGFTGTLDGVNCNVATLVGLFGPVYDAARTVDLIEDGHLSKFRIEAVVLRHPAPAEYLDYQAEMDYICSHRGRNEFLTKLALQLGGNTLLLFQYVEKHGATLERMIREAAGSRPVYYVHGGVDAEERERIRLEIEDESDAIYIASYGTLSTGVNIPKLHNLVFASPSKSRIRNLQSIGRVLRTHESKDTATLYDVADDLSAGGRMNHTLRHFVERVKLYNEQDFEYAVHRLEV